MKILLSIIITILAVGFITLPAWLYPIKGYFLYRKLVPGETYYVISGCKWGNPFVRETAKKEYTIKILSKKSLWILFEIDCGYGFRTDSKTMTDFSAIYNCGNNKLVAKENVIEK